MHHFQLLDSSIQLIVFENFHHNLQLGLFLQLQFYLHFSIFSTFFNTSTLHDINDSYSMKTVMLCNKNWLSILSISGPPDPPRNCTITNQTYDSLQVDCQEGFSSGLNQEFHMEVWAEMQLLVNITARSPRLLARGLPPGHVLFLRVYSSNSKGKSRSVRVEGYTLRIEKHPGVYFVIFLQTLFQNFLFCSNQIFFCMCAECKIPNPDLYFAVTIMNDIFDLL